jgi:hypothetical protein
LQVTPSPATSLLAAEREFREQVRRLRDQLTISVRTLHVAPANVRRVVDTALELADRPPLAEASEFTLRGLGRPAAQVVRHPMSGLIPRVAGLGIRRQGMMAATSFPAVHARTCDGSPAGADMMPSPLVCALIGGSMSGRDVLVERSQALAAPVERVWPLLSGPGALALRPSSFAFDVAAPHTARLRVVVSVPGMTPIFVAYEVREEVRGQVVSLTLPGRRAGGGEVFTLSVVPERAGSRVAIQIRAVVADRKGQAVVADYWQQAVPQWLAGLCDVAEGRAPLPDGRMPAGLQAACAPAALPARPDSVSASVVIAAPAPDVWGAVCAPESAILMSRGAVVLAGVIPGTPVRQEGEFQYFISRLDDGQLRITVTVVKELSAGRFALISHVGRHPLEILYHIDPDSQGTRLELTYRWPGSTPNHQALARSMATAVQNKVRAIKDLIENPSSPWASPHARP